MIFSACHGFLNLALGQITQAVVRKSLMYYTCCVAELYLLKSSYVAHSSDCRGGTLGLCQDPECDYICQGSCQRVP